MQITIDPGSAITIVIAIIAGCMWVVLTQSKLREAIVRVETAVKELPRLRDRVHQIELKQASQDPHRGQRMHPLSRVREDQIEEDEG